jgi:hypothetical protein
VWIEDLNAASERNDHSQSHPRPRLPAIFHAKSTLEDDFVERVASFLISFERTLDSCLVWNTCNKSFCHWWLVPFGRINAKPFWRETPRSYTHNAPLRVMRGPWLVRVAEYLRTPWPRFLNVLNQGEVFQQFVQQSRLLLDCSVLEDIHFSKPIIFGEPFGLDLQN